MSFRGHGADLLGSERIRHSCRWWQPYTSALELHLNCIYSLSQGRGYTGGGRRGGAQDRGSGTQGRGRGGGRGGQPGRGRFVHLHVVINAINAINTLMNITFTRSQSFPDQVRLAACMWTLSNRKDGHAMLVCGLLQIGNGGIWVTFASGEYYGGVFAASELI